MVSLSLRTRRGYSSFLYYIWGATAPLALPVSTPEKHKYLKFLLCEQTQHTFCKYTILKNTHIGEYSLIPKPYSKLFNVAHHIYIYIYIYIHTLKTLGSLGTMLRELKSFFHTHLS